jgi:hypothetical protein
MSNEKERLHNATESLARIKADYKVRMDALEAQLRATVYEWQKSEIQNSIDQTKSIFEGAIGRAEINRIKAEAEYQIQKSAQDEKYAAQRASQEDEIKTKALREWVQAGGEPTQFEAAWPAIRQTVLNERVITTLLDQKKPDTVIKL